MPRTLDEAIKLALGELTAQVIALKAERDALAEKLYEKDPSLFQPPSAKPAAPAA